jgi:hypothetical protein
VTRYTYHGSAAWKYGPGVDDVVQPGQEVDLTKEQVEHVTMLNTRYRTGIHLIVNADSAKPKDKAAADEAPKK